MKSKTKLIESIQLKQLILEKCYKVSVPRTLTSGVISSSKGLLGTDLYDLLVAEKMLDAQLEEERGQHKQLSFFDVA